jgi:hypothetical protein
VPWLRAGDNAATYPRVMRIAALVGSDDRTLNEMFGWLVRCALQSAGHTEDYRIDAGTVLMLGGGRTSELVRIAVKVGLLRQVRQAGEISYELIDDPAFLHMLLKDEIEWNAQRKRDTSTPALCAPVRLRDGDGCRYCGVVTSWGTADRKSGRAGTYDHLIPGRAGTVSTMVIACKTCNSRKGDDRDALVLLDPPPNPFYSAASAEYILKHLGVQVPVSSSRPGSQPAHAPRTGVQPVIANQRPASADNAPDDALSDDGSADPRGPVSGFPGSGRDGSSLEGTGRAGPVRAGLGRGGGRGRRGRGHRG